MTRHAARLQVEDTHRRATHAMIVVGAVGALEALTCVFDELDAPGIVVGLLCYASWIGAAVLYCRWLHSAYRDQADLDGPPLRFSPSQAVASFFLPFVGLVRPYRVIVDLYEGSDPAADARPGAAARPEGGVEASPPRAPARREVFPARSWWALWLVGPLLTSLLDNAGMLGALLSFDPEDPLSLVRSAEGSGDGLLRAVSAAIHVATAALAILVVRAIVRRQDERSRRLELG